MNKNISYLIPLSLIIFGCSTEPKDTNYPESKKIDFVETIHGYEIRDDYRWLEDFTSDESKAWVDEQNRFTQNFIGQNKYKRSITKNLNKTWETESISIPYQVEGKTFYYFNDGTWQQSKLMIKDCDDCDARVLLCLLYTSPSPRDRTRSRMPSSA